jgi:hypothetical protein
MNSNGDYYLADNLGTVIHFMYSTYNRPKMQTFAGYTGSLFYTDGSSALNTPLGRVSSIWGDSNGNLFVVDNFLNVIRKIKKIIRNTPRSSGHIVEVTQPLPLPPNEHWSFLLESPETL